VLQSRERHLQTSRRIVQRRVKAMQRPCTPQQRDWIGEQTTGNPKQTEVIALQRRGQT